MMSQLRAVMTLILNLTPSHGTTSATPMLCNAEGY